MELANKVAMVTGVDEVIGRACMLRLADMGADVIAAGFDRDSVQKAAQEVQALGRRAVAVQLNVDPQQLESLIAPAVKTMGRMDIFAHCASQQKYRPFLDFSGEEWEAAFSEQMDTAFWCCKALVPHMLRQGGGKLLGVVPFSFKNGNLTDGGVELSTASAGISGMMKALARELGPSGISANIVRYGGIENPVNAKAYPAADIPLKRHGTPEEVAEAVVFLAAKEPSFINGEEIDVNGGIYID